jgi:hypothetical protein
MKLKLNQKGADRIDIETMEYDPKDHVFESDDFDDVVMLTVREAEIIEHIIAIFQHYYNIFDGEMKVWQELRKRIEEAEKKND